MCIVGKLDIGKVCKAGLAGEVVEINELTVGLVVCGRTRGTLIGVAVDSYIITAFYTKSASSVLLYLEFTYVRF